MPDPRYSESNDLAYAGSLAHLAGGPRVRVTAARCVTCGEDILAAEYPHAGPLGAFTIAAAVIRQMGVDRIPHTEDCPGPIQWETEPIRA